MDLQELQNRRLEVLFRLYEKSGGSLQHMFFLEEEARQQGYSEDDFAQIISNLEAFDLVRISEKRLDGWPLDIYLRTKGCVEAEKYYKENLDADEENVLELSQKFGILRSEAQLDLDFAICMDDDGGLGLLFLDIDHFKAFNTKHTETIVDRSVLIPFQNLLMDVTRSRGFAYSVGGDEFIILLRNVNPDEARVFALRLLDSVRKHSFPVGEVEETISLSLGLACYPTDALNLHELRTLANQAENEAKRAGGDRIV